MNQNHMDLIQSIYNLLDGYPNPDKRDTIEEGWSIREIIGHLLDSASNNHQRLSRYQAGGNLAFPGYDQIQSVQRAHYNSFDFQTLLLLWFNYNKLFLHMVNHIPSQELTSTLTIGDRPTLTLAALVEDYFAHMEVHQQQIKRIIKA
jgi:hypothetical protein